MMNISRDFKNALTSEVKNPSIIVEIDGVPSIYATSQPKYNALIGDEDLFIGDTDFFFGLPIGLRTCKAYVQFQGTTNSITQQVRPDESTTSGLTKFSLSITDIAEEISNEISKVEPDILSKRAIVYLSFADLVHPKDSVAILYGKVDGISFTNGTVELSITSQDARRDIFQKFESELTAPITNSQTSGIPLLTTQGLFEGIYRFTSYVKIDDELIEFRLISGNNISVATRGALGTIASAHEAGASVESYYIIEGNPIDLILELLTSSMTGGSKVNAKAKSIGSDESVDIDGAIFFKDFDVGEKYGLSAFDYMTLVGSTFNDGEYIIKEFGKTDSGSYILCEALLSDETQEQMQNAVVTFSSRHAVLPDGLGVPTQMIDINEFLSIRDRFLQQAPNVSLILSDTIDVKSVIEKDLMRPIGCYPIPRKGRYSIGFTKQPLTEAQTVVLDKSTVTRASEIKVTRSILKSFYNAVVYRYNPDYVDGKMNVGLVTYSQDSLNRIEESTKALNIDARAFRKETQPLGFFQSISKRFIDRYRFGCLSLSVKPTLGASMAIEIGDAVIFDHDDLKISKLETTGQKLYEVVNKSLNIKSGEVSLELLDTGFSSFGRYASFSPSLKVLSIFQNTVYLEKIAICKTEDASAFSNFVGQKIRFHNEDYSVEIERRILQIANDANGIIIDDSTGIVQGMICTCPRYTDDNSKSKWKISHAFRSPKVNVVSSLNRSSFVPSDITKFFAKSRIRIHKADYSTTSGEIVVSYVDSTTVYLSEPVDFDINNTFMVTGIGFSEDNGSQYNYI